MATLAEGRKAVVCSRPLDPKSTQSLSKLTSTSAPLYGTMGISTIPGTPLDVASLGEPLIARLKEFSDVDAELKGMADLYVEMALTLSRTTAGEPLSYPPLMETSSTMMTDRATGLLQHKRIMHVACSIPTQEKMRGLTSETVDLFLWRMYFNTLDRPTDGLPHWVRLDDLTCAKADCAVPRCGV